LDRQRPLVPLILLLALATAAARGEEPATAIEDRPYRIALHLASDPAARLGDRLRDDLLARWLEMTRRFVGPAWAVEVAEKPSPLVGDGLARAEAEDVQGLDPAVDKAWFVWATLEPTTSNLVFEGREYDAGTRWLGPFQRRVVLSPLDAPRALFLFSLDLFSPSALIVGQEGGRALLKVQGAAIPPASELGAVVTKGTTFIPIRLITMRDESIRITRIAFTYLVAESVEGSTARCAIVSAFRDPLSQRIARPNTLTALGIKPGEASLRLRFVDKTTKGPAAGYTLTERSAIDGPVRDVGMTDRSGRIVVDPGPTRGVVKLRLLAGDSEPLAEFPIMPGESGDEREIAVDPLPLASKYQVRLDALRDSIIDQVALRGRLERLMEARADGEDWPALEALLKEYNQLPSPASFADALKKLKDDAVKTSYESTRTIVLTRHLQAQFDEIQGLIDGYLGDDAARAFGEALESQKKKQAEPAAKKPPALEAPPLPPPGQEKAAVEAAPKAESEKPGAARADVP
jgi:hypothetical protein